MLSFSNFSNFTAVPAGGCVSVTPSGTWVVQGCDGLLGYVLEYEAYGGLWPGPGLLLAPDSSQNRLYQLVASRVQSPVHTKLNAPLGMYLPVIYALLLIVNVLACFYKVFM